MHKLWARMAIILLLICGVASADEAQSNATPNGSSAQDPPMQTFTSAEGRFTIQFPGTPMQDSATASAGTLYKFSVSSDDNNIDYMVTYSDNPNFVNRAPQDILLGARDGAVKAVDGATLTSDAAIDLNGVPGRAFTTTDKDGGSYATHIFLVGNRLYQLLVASNKDHPAAQTEQFMNSFHITVGTDAK
jgi:hypothetical protein